MLSTSRGWLWHHVVCALVTGFGLCALPSGAWADDLEAKEEQAFKQAAALVASSVVKIETVGGLDRVGKVLTATGPTTGLVVGADGYIISSAFNFASKPASILVSLPDGRKLAAEHVATDRLRMLTLIKVDASDLPVPEAAAANKVRVGQWSIALGKTFDDTKPSVSVGIVSATKRIWGKAIQTDAKISPVNYGGPLVDIEGKVLGVLVPLSQQGQGSEIAGVEWYDSGIGFAIPMQDVKKAFEKLRAGKDLVPGLMGLNLKSRDMYETEPVIDRVRFGSPAQKGGLKEGDKILELDGEKITRQAQVLSVMGTKYAGETLKVKVRRGKAEIDAELSLVDKLTAWESSYLGILPARDEKKDETATGVTVRYVYKDSPAAKAGLAKGHRIVEFNGQAITTWSSLIDQMSRIRPSQKAKMVAFQDGKRTETEVTLSTIPDKVADDLRPLAQVAGENPTEGGRKVGRYTETMPAHEHDVWVYVPEDYNPNQKYGLVVWVHPNGDTMEAAMAKAWQRLCDERGLILLSPKAKQIAGWNNDEVEFVKDATELMFERYNIDRNRVVMHGFSNGGRFAYQVAFKHRDIYKGIAVASSAVPTIPPDNEPDARTQFYIISGDKDPQNPAVQGSVQALRNLKYPVTSEVIKGGEHKYPGSSTLETLILWIDALDRI